jgi:actin-related protein
MTRQNKEKMTELMFEGFEVPYLHIANPAVLSLFSQGMVTGVVVDCGNRYEKGKSVNGHKRKM